MTDVNKELTEAIEKGVSEALLLLMQKYSFDAAVGAACAVVAELAIIEGEAEESDVSAIEAANMMHTLIDLRVTTLTESAKERMEDAA